MARAALALCCACFVSGVVHEAIIVYVYHRTTGGAWLAFFSVQVRRCAAGAWLGAFGVAAAAGRWGGAGECGRVGG